MLLVVNSDKLKQDNRISLNDCISRGIALRLHLMLVFPLATPCKGKPGIQLQLQLQCVVSRITSVPSQK